jgi:hypothetical protein
MPRALKLRWAKKLMQARYFVVLTDKESVIALDGAKPESITDILALDAQSAAIADFHDKLGALRDDHERAISKLSSGDKPERSNNTKKPTASSDRKVKKIKVKRG